MEAKYRLSWKDNQSKGLLCGVFKVAYAQDYIRPSFILHAVLRQTRQCSYVGMVSSQILRCPHCGLSIEGKQALIDVGLLIAVKFQMYSREQ